LVPHDELVMKSYMHVWLTTAETCYHNLNANIKNQDYWLLTSNLGIRIQKALNCSTGLKTQGYFPTFWALPVCRTAQSENHDLVYTTKFHLVTEEPQLTSMILFYKHVRNHDQARGVKGKYQTSLNEKYEMYLKSMRRINTNKQKTKSTNYNKVEVIYYHLGWVGHSLL